jgi:hypothetical protein
VLGAFADCMIVLVSAIGGTVEEAQEEVAGTNSVKSVF